MHLKEQVWNFIKKQDNCDGYKQYNTELNGRMFRLVATRKKCGCTFVNVENNGIYIYPCEDFKKIICNMPNEAVLYYLNQSPDQPSGHFSSYYLNMTAYNTQCKLYYTHNLTYIIFMDNYTLEYSDNKHKFIYVDGTTNIYILHSSYVKIN